MITVTRFDQSQFIVNADLIEFVEALPDTHISLVTGRKILVRETPQEILDRVLDYRRAVGSLLSRPVPIEVLKEPAGFEN
jgi:flagellar protein FlbD